MRRYTLSPEAKADIREIRVYLKHEAGPRAVKAVLEKIVAAFVLLSRTPGAGHTREDLTTAPVRFWAVFSYLIVYNPAARPIEIVRVLHGYREVDAILEVGEG